MDTIAFRLKAHADGHGTDFLVVEVYINESSLTDFDYYATDLYEQLRPIQVETFISLRAGAACLVARELSKVSTFVMCTGMYFGM